MGSVAVADKLGPLRHQQGHGVVVFEYHGQTIRCRLDQGNCMRQSKAAFMVCRVFAGTDPGFPFGSAAAAWQNAVPSAIGPPSRSSAACASGWRKLSVIANSAAAKAVVRQPESDRLRIIGQPILVSIGQSSSSQQAMVVSSPRDRDKAPCRDEVDIGWLRHGARWRAHKLS